MDTGREQHGLCHSVQQIAERTVQIDVPERLDPFSLNTARNASGAMSCHPLPLNVTS